MKTPEERGPTAAWAYEARVRLQLSDKQVALALPRPVSDGTIRKAESDSRNMSRPLWRQLVPYYTDVAKEKKVALPPLPAEGRIEEADGGMTELADSIRELTKELRLARLQQIAATDRVLRAIAASVGGRVPPGTLDPIGDEADGDIAR